jgi:hypothetical protein
MLPSEARELKQLREENMKLKCGGPVAGQGHAAGRRSRKVLKPIKRREVVRYLMARYSVGLRRACRCARMSRASYRYKSQRDPQTARS